MAKGKCFLPSMKRQVRVFGGPGGAQNDDLGGSYRVVTWAKFIMLLLSLTETSLVPNACNLMYERKR